MTTICCFSDGFRVLSIDKLFQSKFWSLLSYIDDEISYNFNNCNNIAQTGYYTINTTGNNNFYGSGTMENGNNVRTSSFSNDNILATILNLKPPVFVNYLARSETYIIVGHNAEKSKEFFFFYLSIF